MKLITIPKKYIASFLALVMVFGVFVFVAPVEAQAVEINANATGFGGGLYYSDESGVTSFANGAAIKVVNLMRTSKNEATYTTTDGTNWFTVDAFVWNGGTGKNQFQAWYPATASYDEFTLPTDQNSIEELPAADWMTASTSAMVKPADKTINLAFEHKLAKITVQITESTSQFGKNPLLMAATIYSLSDEYVTVNGGIKPVLGGNAATAIVCPGKYTPETKLMEVTISDDGRQTNLNVPVNAFLTHTGLEAGKHYKFSLKVGKDAISITKVNVEPWTTKEIDGGVAEEVNDISAAEMDAATLNATVTNALVLGYTDITVTLKPDAPAEMITAIRRAICDTEGVADGSIHLTLGGVTSIPDNNNDGIGFGDRWSEYDENNVEIVSDEEVTQLASINLPDVTYIGANAFSNCGNLVSVSAPKAQTIGKHAFSFTALTSVEFPELTTIPYGMFAGTSTLSSAKFPKVTIIEQGGLLIGGVFKPENNPTPFPLELTAEGDITFNGSYHFNVESQNYSGKVDLVLHSNKQDEVTNGNQWKGYTFKSITFVGE